MEEIELKKSLATLGKMACKFENGNDNILPDHATYSDGMRKYDIRADLAKGMMEKSGMDLQKSASILNAAAGTSDKALIPLYVDPSIIDLTRRLTPLIELIPRVTNYGRTAEFNQLTQRGVGGFNVEDCAITEKDDSYTRKSTAIKFAYQGGRVTGPYMAASRAYLSTNYIDALNLEVMNKTKTLRYIEEYTMLNGNATTSSTGYTGVAAPNGAEYDGILNTTDINTQNAASTTIEISGSTRGIRDAIRTARTANASATLGQGNPDMIVTDFKTLDDVKALLQDYQRVVPQDKIAWGYQTVIFEGLPIIPSRFSPTGANSKTMAVMDSSTWQMRMLQDLTYEELAKTNDSYKFMVKVYEALICTAPQFNCKIYGLA